MFPLQSLPWCMFQVYWTSVAHISTPLGLAVQIVLLEQEEARLGSIRARGVAAHQVINAAEQDVPPH